MWCDGGNDCDRNRCCDTCNVQRGWRAPIERVAIKPQARLASTDRLVSEFAVKPQPQGLGGDVDAEAAQRDGQHLDGIAGAAQPQQFLAVRLKLRCLRLLRVACFCDQLGERRWWRRSDIVVCKW